MDAGTVAFVRLALGLKDQPRRGWLRALAPGEPEAGPAPRVESVAEHTWGVALLALVVAEGRDLDRARLLETALVHDVAEAVTGDPTPGEYADRAQKLDEERAALARMLAAVPPALEARFLARFDEYAAGSTPEARLVRDLDKLDMALQAARYAAEGVPEARLAEFVASARAGIRDPALRAFVPG